MYDSNAPYLYDYVNLQTSQTSPSTVHCKNSAIVQYFSKYLMQKAMSPFKWEIPENWSARYFLYTLYTFGFVAVLKTDKFGVIPQGCGLAGYNVFYEPTKAIISNPLIFNKECSIGKDCELIKLQPTYSGIVDIVSYYADLMGLTVEAVGMNLINSKLSYVFASDNRTQAQTFKKLYDNMASGEVANFTDKSLFREDGKPNWLFFNQDVGKNFITDKLLDTLRMIENMFCTDIGIPNANTQKKERMIVDEVNANNRETMSKAEIWLEELKKGCKKVNKMFGLNLSVDWREVKNETDTVVTGGMDV